MFDQTAEWYDALYSWKDYEAESAEVARLIKEHHPKARTVLDVGCGTGEHARFLRREFDIDGVDINEAFVRIAAAKNSGGQFQVADMTDFRLEKTYDAVCCLFSSIGYAQTCENVVRALRCFRNHLAEGGIVVVEPWMTPESWHPSREVHLSVGEKPEGKICRMNLSETDGRMSVLGFHYLVGTADGVRHLEETHRLGLFTREEMEGCFSDAGMDVQYFENGPSGRGLYIGRVASASDGAQ